MTETVNSILYINVSRIGDTLLSVPAIRAVARHYPHAQLDVLAHPKRYEVLENLPYIRSVGPVSKQRVLWKGYLPGKPYDLAFVANYDKALVRYALRVAKRVIAFRQDDEALNARLFRVAEAVPVRSEHAVLSQLRLPAAMGIAPAGLAIDYSVGEAEREWAAEWLQQHGVAGKHPLIGLQIASFPTKAYRDWPVENFAELCARIRQQWPGAYFLIFGGPLEKSRTDALAAQLADAATLCAGQLSLRKTAALMERTDLYIGVDTGPTHMMGALHKPMVALYHGYSPSTIYGPLDHPSLSTIDHPLAGPGCSIEETMAAISINQVWDVVTARLHAAT